MSYIIVQYYVIDKFVLYELLSATMVVVLATIVAGG
jgi:hypothetical protein